jgi:hypothetical protein
LETRHVPTALAASRREGETPTTPRRQKAEVGYSEGAIGGPCLASQLLPDVSNNEHGRDLGTARILLNQSALTLWIDQTVGPVPTPADCATWTPFMKYSYPWCATYLGGTGLGGGMSCYYSSWEQCRTTMLGIGGNRVESPYYHAQSTPLPHRSWMKPRHHRHT